MTTFQLGISLLCALILPIHASAQTVIIDTGTPVGSVPGAELCGASCGGGATFQDVAGQFTLSQGYSISSAQVYITAPATGGQMAVVIRADSSGTPGASIYSQTYTVPNQASSGWVVFTFTNQPVLAGNTPYWLSFEPVPNSTIIYPLDGVAPNPLPSYAFYNSRNSGWIVESLSDGMRLSGTPAASPTLLIDTGAPTSTTDGAGVYNTGSSNYEYIAGQFTLTQAASISSVSGWMQVGTGGSVNVNIYAGNGTPLYPGDNIPGNSIYTQNFTIPFSPSAGWVSFPFSTPNPVLPAGTYWVSFEPAVGTFYSTMFDGAPNPLPNYAYYFNLNGRWANGSINTPPFSMGMQVYGSSFAGVTYGTAARTIETGTAFGIPDTPQDLISGADSQVDTFSYNFIIPSGWSEARGTLIQNGLLASAYSAQSGPCTGGGSCTDGTGAGRGVSYRTWQNTSTQSLPFVVNAVLDGEFQGSGGVVSAGIYVIDATAFSTAVANSGLATPQFLLNGSTLTALSTGGSSLAGLFTAPGAVLLNYFQNVTGTPNTLLTIPLAPSSSVNIAPGETIVVVFDVAAYAGPGGTANFASTLAPSPTLPLLSDASGNPLSQLVAVGPSAPMAASPASIVLTPSMASYQVGGPASVTATVTDSGGNPIQGALVFFGFNSGPNTSPAGPIVTGSNGQAVFTYNGNAGAGTDMIGATVAGTITATPVSVSWTLPGVLDHITISPSSATISPGGTQPYTAEGFDRLNDDLGSVTTSTTFSITPDGSCTGASCTATATGPHLVTGNDGGKTAQASLTVSSLQTPSITFGAAPTPVYLGGNFMVSATTNSDGALTYSYVSGPCAQVSGGTFSSSGGGTCVVKAATALTSNFAAGSITQNVIIGPATPTITFGTAPSPSYPGGNFMVSATTNSNGALTYSYVSGPCTQVSGGTFSSSGTGMCVIQAATALTTNFIAGSTTQSVNITAATGKTTPTITWAAPAAITYGTPLTGAQLDATANVQGTFVYTPAVRTILTAGSHTLSVTFTPSNTSSYTTATANVTLQVNQATPEVLWLPIPTVYGTPLGPLQLDALTIVPGKFSYTPPAGTILHAGNQQLSATFTPNDTTDFQTVTVHATLVVVKASPDVDWSQPLAIVAGTALSAKQLDATANVPGTLVYNPPAGTILPSGAAVLRVTFTPTDTTDYQSQSAQVTLTVKKAGGNP